MKSRTSAASSRKAILTTVSSDSHSWNLIFMELFLLECGYEVTNLGPCCPTELTVARALETRYDVIVISSINGHAVIEAPEILRTLRRAGVQTPVAIGGKLDTSANAASEERLREVGFNGVFADTSSTMFDDFIAFLDRDDVEHPRPRVDCEDCAIVAKSQAPTIGVPAG